MKFRQIDEAYFARRKAYAAKHGGGDPAFWARSDYWPLYAGYANLARYVAILDIVRRSLTVPGDVAEFGVYRGANFLFVAKLMRLFDPMGWKQVHGFDSFQGLTTFAEVASRSDATNQCWFVRPARAARGGPPKLSAKAEAPALRRIDKRPSENLKPGTRPSARTREPRSDSCRRGFAVRARSSCPVCWRRYLWRAMGRSA